MMRHLGDLAAWRAVADCALADGPAGAERGSRVSPRLPNRHYGRMRAPEHAPRGPFRLLERRHGLADIVERGALGL